MDKLSRLKGKVREREKYAISHIIINSAGSKENSHLIRDICLSLGEFVVVSQLMIFLLKLLGSAEKPMAIPRNYNRKIVS